MVSIQANAQSWLSRQWHNSVSHYNYYYNANLLVSDVREESLIGYKDNYKDVLSLYPIPDQASLKGNASKMDEVLKKCSHIIDKHSKSKWVDDAYLLMGDAQLFKGDFYSAIEVYEFVAGTYKKSIPASQAEINLIVTYILLNKFEDAEALYSKLSSNKEFPAKLKTQLNIAGAAVNIKQKKYAVAIQLLETAIPEVRNKLKKVRYNFVLAQLYALNKNNPSASERYTKVIKLNPPYEFAFNAKLNLAKAINIKNKGEIRNAKYVLRDMLRDDKNIDYFDQIYYELGNLEVLDKNDNAAAIEYRKSLSSKTSDFGLKSYAYLALADIFFKQQDYENAQLYYDSAARTVDPTHQDFQKIQDKNLVLNELIKHLVNIREKDSLLRLADNEKLRERVIDNLIREAKEKEEQEKQKQELNKLQQNNLNNPGGAQTTSPSSTNFPFYNTAARTKGLQDFQRIWGTRELMDFWAISSNKSEIWKKIDNEQKTNDLGSEQKRSVIDNAPDERKKYYENIPFTKLEKQKMMGELAESYFLGANVYYQDLKEYEKAKKLLEELLNKYPNNSYQINAWYLMAKINQEQKNEERVQYYINLIRKADSTSNFLNVLLNKDGPDSTSPVKKADDSIEKLYANAFNSYKAKQYDQTLAYKSENDLKYPGNPLQVNFDYLEALIFGEKGDLKTFQTKLQAIVDNYPNSDIAAQALKTIELIKIKNGEITAAPQGTGKYTYNATADHFYMLIVPKNTDLTQFKLAFLNFNKSFFGEEGLKVTTSLLGEDQVLIVNNFKSPETAQKYLIQMRTNMNFFMELKLLDFSRQYLISKDNFSILINDKILSDYDAFFKANYKF